MLVERWNACFEAISQWRPSTTSHLRSLMSKILLSKNWGYLRFIKCYTVFVTYMYLTKWLRRNADEKMKLSRGICKNHFFKEGVNSQFCTSILVIGPSMQVNHLWIFYRNWSAKNVHNHDVAHNWLHGVFFLCQRSVVVFRNCSLHRSSYTSSLDLKASSDFPPRFVVHKLIIIIFSHFIILLYQIVSCFQFINNLKRFDHVHVTTDPQVQ